MSSIRFQGISSLGEFFEIKSYLEGLKGYRFLQSSGIASRGSGDFEATITFRDRADKDKAMGILQVFLPETFPEIHIDDKLMGITILASPYGCQKENSVDIVAIHGLEGHATNTWTCSIPNARIWLRDFLPRNLPNARVMSFGYESHIMSKSVAGIEDTARQLLNGLKSRRETESASTRPLIFIAHSLGGLVVKKAISIARSIKAYNSIHDHTCCVTFFATPHRGSATASWGNALAQFLQLCKTISTQNLSVLRENSSALSDLAREFLSVQDNDGFRIFSIYELEKTKVGYLKSIMVVGKDSAVLNLPNETLIPVNAPHQRTGRFRTQTDEGYEILVNGFLEVLNSRGTKCLSKRQGSPVSDPQAISTRSNTSSTISSSTNSGPIYFPAYVPVDPHFFGRGNILREIQEKLCILGDQQWPPCVALVGTPGMGKTSLATHFMHTQKDHFGYLFLISAESRPKLLQDFRYIYKRLKLGDDVTPDDAEAVRDLVLAHLTTTDKRWLIVFDNADESGILVSSWPRPGNGAVIVTSRNKHIVTGLPNNTKIIPVGGLEEDECVGFVISRLDFQSDQDPDLIHHCKRLVQHFNCWPLALRQLSAFMEQSHTNPKEMTDLIQKTSDIDWRIYSFKDDGNSYMFTLHTAWETILSSLSDNSSMLLNILSLLDPGKIHTNVFTRPRFQYHSPFKFLSDDFEYRSARGNLLKYDIITMPEEETLSVHRVVQNTRLLMLTESKRREAFDTTLTILSACFPRQKLGNHMNGDWNDCERFFAHVLAFDTAVQKYNPVLADYGAYINLICDVTWYLWEIGQYDEALERLDWIEKTCAKTVGLNTLEAARVYVNRGSVFSSLNRYDEAGQLFQKGLAARKMLLPIDNQLLGNSYMQVGNYYASQGKIEEAIRAHRQVIRIRENSPETPPGIMIISYFNICRCLLSGTQLAEAERQLKMAQVWENKLTQEESLYYKNDRLYILGNILLSQGQNEGSLAAHIEAYETRKSIKTPKYQLSASLHKIGTIYQILGSKEKAITTLNEAISILESTSGDSGPNMLRLARTEMKLAETVEGAGSEMWKQRAMKHYTEASNHSVSDWDQVDFDKLVPLIDR